MTKKILITGKNSYIGRSFIEYCEKNEVDFEIDELDVRGDEWKTVDFSPYDVVYHVAGIAHIKETKKNKPLYYQVNRDLAVEVANKTKISGVKHFIFMSTMSVYGLVEGHIDMDTPTNPVNAYGKSKLEAEEEIFFLKNDSFIISVIRPPMIYGPGSKGNYSTLSKLAKKTKFFPKIDNKRSMLFIDNLSIFLASIIKKPVSNYYYPQNCEYVSTTELVNEISLYHKNKIYFTSFFNCLIRRLKINVLKKVFGNLTYEKNMTQFNTNQIYSFKETVYLTENKTRN